MKTQKKTVGQWLRSLFSKPKESVQVSNPIQKEEEPVKEWHPEFTMNEMPDLEVATENEVVEEDLKKQDLIESKSLDSVKWKILKKNEIEVRGKKYFLTDKQLFFYNQFKNAGKPIDANFVSREFMYHTTFLLSAEQFKAIPKHKFKIGAHRKTMAGLIKAGLIKHLGKDVYKAKK